MTNSNNLLLTPPRVKWPLVVLGLLAFVGFADAAFLTIKHYTGGTIPCSILDGCDTVTRSAYSMIASVPVALLGALFYLAVLALVILYAQNNQTSLIKTIWFLSLIAFLASLVFVYLQVFVIRALCLYCLASAVTSMLIFLLVSFRRTI